MRQIRIQAIRDALLCVLIILVATSFFAGYPLIRAHGPSQATLTVSAVGNQTETITKNYTFTAIHRLTITDNRTVIKSETITQNQSLTATTTKTLTVHENSTVTSTVTVTRTCTITTDFDDGCCSYLHFCKAG